MSISSIQLDAFVEIVKNKSFSKAAKNLFITQSALSQRIANLEEDLGIMLLVRGDKVIVPTPFGEKLLQYCLNKSQLEKELMSELHDDVNNESGSVTIGSFSTFTRSLLLPHIFNLKKERKNVSFEIQTKEVGELFPLLKSSSLDYIFTPESKSIAQFICKQVYVEQYVLIETRNKKILVDNVYLDHDETDKTTINFFKSQANAPKSIDRIYFDEIYTILDAVALGFGRAVVPLHLIKEDARFKVVNNYKLYEVPIYLIYRDVIFPTKLHKYLMKKLGHIKD